MYPVKLTLLAFLIGLLGCPAASNTAPPDTSGTDAGTDAGTDTSGTDAVGTDTGTDAGTDVAADTLSVWQPLQAQVQNAVGDLQIPGAAMGVAFADTGEVWLGAAGMADKNVPEPWTVDRAFRIGSVTKTFTAALVLLLVDDKVLTLDDPLETWVPGYYDALGVTLRHMLSNTSGIVSYNYVGSFNRSKSWTPIELAQWAVDHEPALRFAPGSQFEYSNTNFVLLGLVIEAASGASYEDQVSARLTGPLGLTETYVAASGDTNPALVSCYDQDGADITNTHDPSFGWAAGAIASTPHDLARWGAALYGGQVLSAGALESMVTPFVLSDGSVSEYGLGTFIESDGADTIYGHTGGIGGYQTYLYFWKTDRIALVATSNMMGVKLRDLAGYGWSVPLGFDFP